MISKSVQVQAAQKGHVFKSVSFTAGLEYLNSLSVRTTRTTPSIEPPVIIPDPVTPEPSDETITYANEVTLSRTVFKPEVSKIQHSITTITATSEPKLLTLTDPYTGENYKYTITSTDSASHDVTFEFLFNDRLVVTGEYIKIQAWDLNVGDVNEQHDDMIIVGNYNEIYTGKGNDIVRVGEVIGDRAYIYTQGSEDNYGKCFVTGSSGKQYYASAENKVYTGDGDDYITMYGSSYTVDAGDGNDSFLVNTNYMVGSIPDGYLMPNSSEGRILTNCETSTSKYTNTSTVDGKLGWTRQGSEGDCQIFSFLNSLKQIDSNGNVVSGGSGNNNLDLSAFGISIVPNKDSNNTITGYTVTFDRYNYSGKTNTTVVTSNTLSSYTGCYGDIDARILMIAIKQLIKVNEGYDDVDMRDDKYNKVIPKYFYGNTDCYCSPTNQYVNIDMLSKYWELYQNNIIDNIYIGTNLNSSPPEMQEYLPKYGISKTHAYAVKNIDMEKQYVELVNPYDGNDVMRIPFTILIHFYMLEVMGYTEEYCNEQYALLHPETT